MRVSLFIICIIFLFSCANNKKEIAELFPENSFVDQEVAMNGHLYYSDSAKVKVKIAYEELRRIEIDNEQLMEFPQGIQVEFYDDQQAPQAWLISKYALRNIRDGTIIVRDSVVLYNDKNDKLVTSELTWNEKDEKIYTDKYVRITQPARGDTSYGYGLRAKQDFSEFEIGKFSGTGSISGLK